MRRHVSPRVARQFTVFAPHLPGYCGSDKPPRGMDWYFRRPMGKLIVDMMKQLGHPTFMAVGHDRGGRVAYRMALDHPTAVLRLRA